jgi:hypothetical protein
VYHRRLTSIFTAILFFEQLIFNNVGLRSKSAKKGYEVILQLIAYIFCVGSRCLGQSFVVKTFFHYHTGGYVYAMKNVCKKKLLVKVEKSASQSIRPVSSHTKFDH